MEDGLVFEVRGWMQGFRLDRILKKKLAPISRHYWGKAVDAGEVTVGGKCRRRSYRVQEGQEIRVCSEALTRIGAAAWAGEISVLYEDEHILAVNKPAGLIVHPINLLTRGAVTQWIEDRYGAPAHLCHRLDRFTSGLILVARSPEIARIMMEAFVGRHVSKVYLALVEGAVEDSQGSIDLPLRKAPESGIRLKMLAEKGASISAKTSWKVIERFSEATLLEVSPHTGRQHQIRAHLEALGHPIVNDRLYGPVIDFEYFNSSVGNRSAYYDSWHALHAHRLSFCHPVTKTSMCIEAPVIGAFAAYLRKNYSRITGEVT